jgi:asparagine synthase (glutamine-hydrolysing)
MCGIAGILNFDGRAVDAHEIEVLTDALAHRGRDNAAIALGGASRGRLSAYPGLALGHRRLSVIDLSAESAQPMTIQDGHLWIVYNGELYNYLELRQELVKAGHRFRTHSDTEVVLVAFLAWGEACLAKFNGMFAFAIWNETTQSLFCARDPLGIKPFYYMHDERSFRFSSESQALMRGKGLVLNPKAVTSYFLSMYVPRHLSIFSGVQKLLPGHSIRVTRDGKVSVNSYWTLPPAGHRSCALADAAKELEESLHKAVALQLRCDVPVGVLLSGGFDSGMIVASASRRATSLHTYSVGFDDGVQFNELPIAKALANRYGTLHRERLIRSEEVMGLLDKAITSMSEPVADSAMVPTFCLSQMAADDGVKVLLSGTGGDEVFAGYSRYVGSSGRRKILYWLPRFLRQFLGRTIWGNTTFGARLRHSSLDMMLVTGGSVQLAGQFFESERAFNDFLEELVQEVFPTSTAGSHGLYENMQFDLQVYLPDLLLMLLDQLTMAHTVEGRVPLLDVELLGASYSLSSELHAMPCQSETRRLMRRIAADKLDPRTFSMPKQGFSGPVRPWIERNQSRFQERVMDSRQIPILRDLPLKNLWKTAAQKNNPFWATEVFSIYCFSTWYQAHASNCA